MTEGLYLYCLVRSGLMPVPLQGIGLDGHNPLQAAPLNDLAAIWSPVALEDFCGPEAEARLQDLTWIGPRVIRHQEVVAALMRHSPVLPVRFGVIFTSRESLENSIQRHYDRIDGFLRYVSGTEEWGVKGFLDWKEAKEKLFARRWLQDSDRLKSLSPGKRYFAEQRQRASVDLELQRWLPEVCQKIWQGLQHLTVEGRERELRRRDAGDTREMVLNWAFLISTGVAADFRAHIREVNNRLADLGLVLEETGPWPPYSFCPALDMESVR